jgi:hypothetical protein
MNAIDKSRALCTPFACIKVLRKSSLAADLIFNISPGRTLGVKCASVLTIVILLFASLAALAQEPQEPSGNAGLRFNGFIESSGLRLYRSLLSDKQQLIRGEKEMQP